MDTAEKPIVLIVDDKAANLTALRALLEDLDITLIEADSGNDALHLMLDHDVALVLMDVQMPEMDGFETAELMRMNQMTRHVPIIFVTAISKEQAHIFKGYEAGAVDYIFKPLDPLIIRNKVKIFVDLFVQKQLIKNKNLELERANATILKQQQALIREERLNVLLQMAGTAAHELNQPLMILLGNLQMLEMVKDDHDKVMDLIPKIRKAGETISDTVKRIQNVRHDVTVKHDSGGTSMIDLDQGLQILLVEDSEVSYKLIRAYCQKHDHIRLTWTKTVKEGIEWLKQTPVDLILLDYMLPDGTGLEFIEQLKSEKIDLPVVAITGKGDENIASRFIAAGAYEYLPKTNVTSRRLLDVIRSAVSRHRLKKEIRRSVDPASPVQPHPHHG